MVFPLRGEIHTPETAPSRYFLWPYLKSIKQNHHYDMQFTMRRIRCSISSRHRLADASIIQVLYVWPLWSLAFKNNRTVKNFQDKWIVTYHEKLTRFFSQCLTTLCNSHECFLSEWLAISDTRNWTRCDMTHHHLRITRLPISRNGNRKKILSCTRLTNGKKYNARNFRVVCARRLSRVSRPSNLYANVRTIVTNRALTCFRVI